MFNRVVMESKARWLPYFAPVAIMAVAVACAVLTVIAEPRQPFAAEASTAVARWMAAMESGVHISQSGV